VGLKKFKHYRQIDSMDCGLACIRMIAAYHGLKISIRELRMQEEISRQGATLKQISALAEKAGFNTFAAKLPLQALIENAQPPYMAHWNQNHFVVVHQIEKTKNGEYKFHVADPAFGELTYSEEEFLSSWICDNEDQGVVLLMEPTENMALGKTEKEPVFKNISFLFDYLRKQKKLVLKLIAGILIGSLLQLLFPFLTQSIIDTGIKNQDLHFIYLVLLGQLLVFAGKTTVDVVRGRVMLHLSTRLNVSLVSDFFLKLMKLPISYFDSKMTGELMQRIIDHNRIENFLTGSSINVIFSVFNLLVFSCVLAVYNLSVFFVFLLGSVAYAAWALWFLKYRAAVDFKLFQQHSESQGKVIEMINGMQEIKLHNAEEQKRTHWETLQMKLLKVNVESLSILQWQSSGAAVINELKNIIITVLSATFVIEGKLSLGMMLAISYIIGQLNVPLTDFITFIQQWQDARLSLERLAEIHNLKNEETDDSRATLSYTEPLPIHVENVSYHYPGMNDQPAISELNITIMPNTITAIVGSSGSGKTTLMKLLLKFYSPQGGEVLLGSQSLKDVSAKSWREKCGVVMQEGYIFSDTIANNIAIGHDEIDPLRLRKALMVANILDYVESLPMGHRTKIGMDGQGLSTGQKQRILIARAVYKNPDYLFFDEATSALDTNNEKIIMNNLHAFFCGRTVVIAAHRLSTVKNADQIIVLEHGRVIECGKHHELVSVRGKYYDLVKNQLELEMHS